MDKLKRKQAEWLSERACVAMRLMDRVRTRLEQRGYRSEHRLYQAVVAAYNALHTLRVLAHYESFDGSVGEPTNREGDRG